MKQVILLIPVFYGNARKACERVERETFDSLDSLKEIIVKEMNCELEEEAPILTYELTDFMDEFNNQNVNDENYFMSYVNIRYKKFGS